MLLVGASWIEELKRRASHSSKATNILDAFAEYLIIEILI
jgi:hypothetical protein